MSQLSTPAKRNIVLLGAATLLTVVVLAGTILFNLGNNAQADKSADGMDEARVKTLIETYIDNNIAAIHKKLTAYMQEEQKRQQQQKTEDAFKNPKPELIRDYNPTKGPEDADITIVDYSEFECPFCGRSRSTLNQLEEKYAGNIRFVFKHYPLPFHDNAIPAGRAAYAAHQQGKFWEYHDKLFANQKNLGDAFYIQAAKELDLDIEQFNKDRKSEASKEAVEKDMADGKEVGVRGTPYFLINGVGLSGAQPLQNFERIIKRLQEEE